MWKRIFGKNYHAQKHTQKHIPMENLSELKKKHRRELKEKYQSKKYYLWKINNEKNQEKKEKIHKTIEKVTIDIFNMEHNFIKKYGSNELELLKKDFNNNKNYIHYGHGVKKRNTRRRKQRKTRNTRRRKQRKTRNTRRRKKRKTKN